VSWIWLRLKNGLLASKFILDSELVNPLIVKPLLGCELLLQLSDSISVFLENWLALREAVSGVELVNSIISRELIVG